MKFFAFQCAFAVWIIYAIGVDSFIVVPEELPSILSIFYSNVPPIKKGTDSRIGIGFRLGPNADFQVQFELGPQKNTQPIGPNASSSAANTSKKRQTSANSASTATVNGTASQNPSEKWLSTWKLNLDENSNQHLHQPEQPHQSDPTKENFDFVNHLRKLYNSDTAASSIASNSTETATE